MRMLENFCSDKFRSLILIKGEDPLATVFTDSSSNPIKVCLNSILIVLFIYFFYSKTKFA